MTRYIIRYTLYARGLYKMSAYFTTTYPPYTGPYLDSNLAPYLASYLAPYLVPYLAPYLALYLAPI